MCGKITLDLKLHNCESWKFVFGLTRNFPTTIPNTASIGLSIRGGNGSAKLGREIRTDARRADRHSSPGGAKVGVPCVTQQCRYGRAAAVAEEHPGCSFTPLRQGCRVPPARR